MLFKDITYIDENFNTVEHAYIGTKNGVIDYISTEKPDWGYGEVYDGTRRQILRQVARNWKQHQPRSNGSYARIWRRTSASEMA